MSDTEEKKTRKPRTLRDRVGDLEPTAEEIEVKGEKRTVTRPGSGSLGNVRSAIAAVRKGLGKLAEAAPFLDQLEFNLSGLYEAIKPKLDIVPESHRESRALVVGDEVVPSVNATDKMKERFGAEARKVASIDLDNGLVTIEGYGILPRTMVVEKAMALMIANRKPRNSGADADSDDEADDSDE